MGFIVYRIIIFIWFNVNPNRFGGVSNWVIAFGYISCYNEVTHNKKAL